jgi:hypothetical protein
MPFTQNYALLRFGGAAWSGLEEWSCGLKLKHIGGDALAPMLQECKDTIEVVAGIIADYLGPTRASGFPSSHHLDWVMLNPILATTGKYAFPNDAQIFERVAPLVGTAVPGIPQVAYCVTTRSLIKRGPAAWGRWYMPAPSASTTTTGVQPEVTCQAYADNAGSFLNDLRNVDSGQGPTAWSPWHYGQGKAGAADASVASVQVGNVWDTQRRRRNSIPETYFAATTWT